MDYRNNYRTGPLQWQNSSARNLEERRWNPLDIIFVVLLTLVSALLSFHDLGNRTAPQTFWKPDHAEKPGLAQHSADSRSDLLPAVGNL